MASGTLDCNQSVASGRYIDSKVVWSSTANKVANTSDANAKLYVRKGDTAQSLTIPTEGTWTYSFTFGSKSVSGSVYLSVLEDWVLVSTITLSGTAHNSDGSLSVSIAASVSAPAETSLAGHTTKGSGTAKFDTIPRASYITSADNVNIGSPCSIKWTPNSSAFRYRLKFELSDWNYTTDVIYPNKTSAYTYTGYSIPYDAARQIPDKTSGTMKVTLYTYSDSAGTKQIGSESSKTFTVTVPQNSETKPDFSMTLSPVSALSSQFDGLYIAGKTKVKAEFTGSGKYGAFINGYNVKVDGAIYEHPYMSEYLSQYGTFDVVGTAEDSRGFKNTDCQQITVIPYNRPKINVVECSRCDSEGIKDDAGTYLLIKATRTYSAVKDGSVQKNFCEIQYRYAKRNGTFSEWNTLLDKNDVSSDYIDSGALLDGALLSKFSYIIEIRAIDDIGDSSAVAADIASERIYMHRDGSRMSLTFGGYIEEDNTVSIVDGIKAKLYGGIYTSHIDSICDYYEKDFNELIHATGYYAGTISPGSSGCTNYPLDKPGALHVTSVASSEGETRYAYQMYMTDDGDICTRGYSFEKGFSQWKIT